MTWATAVSAGEIAVYGYEATFPARMQALAPWWAELPRSQIDR